MLSGTLPTRPENIRKPGKHWNKWGLWHEMGSTTRDY